jgi:hypothetical protein
MKYCSRCSSKYDPLFECASLYFTEKNTHGGTFQLKLLCLISSLHLLRGSIRIFIPFYFVCLLDPKRTINELNHKFKHLDSQPNPSHRTSPWQETHQKGFFLQIHPQSPSTPSGSEQHTIFPPHISRFFHFLWLLREPVLVCVTTNVVRLVFGSNTLSEFLSISDTFIHVVFKCWIYIVKCFPFLASVCQDFLGLLSWLQERTWTAVFVPT